MDQIKESELSEMEKVNRNLLLLLRSQLKSLEDIIREPNPYLNKQYLGKSILYLCNCIEDLEGVTQQ